MGSQECFSTLSQRILQMLLIERVYFHFLRKEISVLAKDSDERRNSVSAKRVSVPFRVYRPKPQTRSSVSAREGSATEGRLSYSGQARLQAKLSV